LHGRELLSTGSLRNGLCILHSFDGYAQVVAPAWPARQGARSKCGWEPDYLLSVKLNERLSLSAPEREAGVKFEVRSLILNYGDTH